MRLIAVMILSLGLQACDAAGARKFEEAKAAVSEMLNDPTSAEWKDISANGPCVQGLVNAKNGFGGYVGYKRFFYNTSLSEARIKFYEAQTRCIESSIKYMEREAAK